LAVTWRRAGVPVEKLFVCPLAAKSLADFWSNRWNRAFSGFARELIFRPLARRLGTTGATLAVFLFSGLAHELVISVPAAGGYGGPMLYFLIQGLLVLVENTRAFRRAMRNRPMCAWLWTAAGVLGPMPLLFHRPFLERVVLPFLAALGG
jgi:D-alanyl-lipoteichoic acid acyltransferase DltB (MBOAT superfamily)